MTDWHHAPIHRFGEATHFFITAGTYLKQHFYHSPEALDALQRQLFAQAKAHDCCLQAWALLSNHYHFVVQCDEGERVREMIARFHSESAIELNERDHAPGRRVWYQYWDKTLTFEIVARAAAVHARERGAPWDCPCGDAVSVVFGELVREDGAAEVCADRGEDEVGSGEGLRSVRV